MKREDMISVVCKLKYCCHDFPTILTNFTYEIGNRKYEITFERAAGKLIQFQILDIGLSEAGEKEIREQLEVGNENN
jgi:hypothetical protein